VDGEVDRVLAERERRARRGPAVVSLGAAAFLHTAVAVLIVLGPRLAPPPPPLDYVAVQVVPAQRLGGERQERHEAPETPRPPAPAPPPPPAPAPAADEPPPPPARSDDAPVLHQAPPPPAKAPKTPKTKPLPPDTRVDPTTLPKFLPPPREMLAQKLRTQPPAPTAAAPGLPGAATGTPTGKAEVGSSITALDNPDFTYDYYIAQLVALIDQNWTRPPVANGVRAIVSFRIRRDGSITGVEVRQSSSLDTFDLAALRAVQNAAPFPPLPRAYTLNHDSVGVNVTLR
jgi:TonB family protein